MPERGEDLLRRRWEKLQRLRLKGIDPYPPRYRRSHTNQEAHALFQQVEAQQGSGARTQEVALAGRITALRGMGKASFLNLRDGSQRIQVYLRRDLLDIQYDLLKELDLGDFIGVRGPLFRTRSGDVTLEALEITVLCKTLRPLPEKWHGLQDTEKRYRQRYLDLIASEEPRGIFQLRSRIITALRRFLDGHGFLEVETPILVQVAAGAMARPFVTHHNALDRNLYLRIATELYLKRLIVGGLDKVYEIGRVFRNEGIDLNHNPEFTLLESYEAYADYNDVMVMVEEMLSFIAQEVQGSTVVRYGGEEIDLSPPWRRLSLQEAVYQYSGIDFQKYPDAPSLAARVRELGVEAERSESRGRLIDKLVGTFVEPRLIQPTFLLDYPVEMTPLAKSKGDDPGLVERFEGFAGSMEIANAFTELNDPSTQRERLQDQEQLSKQYGDEDLDRLDEQFLVALEHGMPPTGGLGIGVDRLVMLLTGQRSIREVVLFPQLRSLE